MLLGHRGPGAWRTSPASSYRRPPALVRLILGRSAYATAEERDARPSHRSILKKAAA